MSALTLKSFFCDGDGPPVAGADLLAAFRTGEDPFPGAVLPGLSGACEQALEDVFSVPLGQVLEASWGKVEGLRQALAASLLDPDGVMLVPLLDHTVTSTHSPKIDLFLGGKQLGALSLGIQLSLKLKGVGLEVRGGRITGLRSGECAGEGVFSCQGQPLLKRKTPATPLPGRVDFA